MYMNKIFDWQDVDKLGDIEHLIIPDGTVEIADEAFSLYYIRERNYEFIADERSGGWWDMKPDPGIISVTFPDSVKKIGDYAFKKMVSIEEIHFGRGLEIIGEGAFMHCSIRKLELPDTVTEIGEGAFSYCCLESVKFPSRFNSIDGDIFYGCTRLEELYIPDSVTEIDEGLINMWNFFGIEPTIFCSKNSYAHKFAVENKLPFSLG